MGRLSDESFEQFLLAGAPGAARASLESAWELATEPHVAAQAASLLATLAANGKPLGIRFVNRREGANDAQIWNAFARFNFPSQLQAAFASSLKSEH